MKKLFSLISEFSEDFFSLIYPRLCFCCDQPLVKQEKIMCTRCNIELPRTHYHLIPNNPVEQLFWGRIKIEKASAFYIFQKGSKYQSLLHSLKYKGYKDIGVELGRKFSAELLQNNFFNEIDVIVPVPLHPKKERVRGFNQSLTIAEGMAINLKKPIDSSNLYRKRFSETQTQKGRFERWQNVDNLFLVHNTYNFDNKHILLVDDVVTTGSTLEACAHAIQQSKNAKVSIATLAFAAI